MSDSSNCSGDSSAGCTRPVRIRAIVAGLWGSATGTLIGVIASGVCSAIYGQPFVGVTGWRGFVGGLVFPGLLMICPVTAPIGFVAGVVVGLGKRFLLTVEKGHNDE